MKSESTIKPSLTQKFSIEHTHDGKCNVHFYENVTERINDFEDTVYEYDTYVLYGIPYHDNLEGNIAANETAWLDMAKAAENAEPEYTKIQKIEQEITDQMLENIEQGQQITDLELLILGGMENV